MSLVPGATSMKPSRTRHSAGPPFPFRHLERSLPSNSTIASDGGFPGAAGVMTGGRGRLRSWTFQRVSESSAAHKAAHERTTPAQVRLHIDGDSTLVVYECAVQTDRDANGTNPPALHQ